MTPSHSSPPSPLGSRKRHYWLVQRMAAAIGVDLNAAFESGDLASDDWAQTVEACRNCDWVEGCEKWLAQGGEGSAAPALCMNRATFTALQAAQGAAAHRSVKQQPKEDRA